MACAWNTPGLPDKCARRLGFLVLTIWHEPARQGRDPEFHLSARLSVSLRARRRGDRGAIHRPGARLQAAELYRGRRLRQGRTLRRAHSPSRTLDVSAAPDRTKGL